MAWTSQGEEVLAALKEYVAHLKPEEAENLSQAYNQAMTPFLGEWMTLGQITFVTLRNRDHVLSNLSLAVLKESIGLGPQFYCVIRSYNLDFESFLMLSLHYLPREKFCMYPEDEILRGPFLYAPWDSIGHRLCTCPSISLEGYLDYLAYRARNDAQP